MYWDIMITVGDIMSTPGGVQCTKGIMSTLVGYPENTGGCTVHWGES